MGGTYGSEKEKQAEYLFYLHIYISLLMLRISQNISGILDFELCFAQKPMMNPAFLKFRIAVEAEY